MTLIQTKLNTLDIVTHNGREYAISNFLTDQKERRSLENDDNGKRVKGKLLGYDKPEITVFRIHHGKVLTSSDKYIGEDYTIPSACFTSTQPL